MTTYWFKQKRYGYGAAPVTWQGWAIVAAAVADALGLVWVLQSFALYSPAAWAKLIVFALIAGVLWTVGIRMTEGGWRWRWGGE